MHNAGERGILTFRLCLGDSFWEFLADSCRDFLADSCQEFYMLVEGLKLRDRCRMQLILLVLEVVCTFLLGLVLEKG